jgi:hypothetical protein
MELRYNACLFAAPLGKADFWVVEVLSDAPLSDFNSLPQRITRKRMIHHNDRTAAIELHEMPPLLCILGSQRAERLQSIWF